MWDKPNRVARSRGGLKRLLSFHDYYSSVHLLDIEWLLSTLFDASLFRLRAAGNGGSFFSAVPIRGNKWSPGRPSSRIPRLYGSFGGSLRVERGRAATMS